MRYYLIISSIFCVALSNIYPAFSQQHNTTWQKAVIWDSITHKPLKDVRIAVIYQNDTTQIQSNSSGEFQYTAKPGTKLLLKKRGYAWRIVKVHEGAVKKIVLLPNKYNSEKEIGKENIDKTEIIFDGQLVVREEWDDVGNMDKDETNMEIRNAKLPWEKNKIIITSK
ncbi:hypothetical protein FACS189426_05600 [Bacteroidia bacterium]|nr:hypothetical protein FACS189426_05600 [Bacteroidia bacterium]GHT85342.1 hypothetical protein FACS18947_3980 [Bacteroidia bacterium]